MTTDETEMVPNFDRMNENLAKVEELSQRLIAALGEKREIDPSLQGPEQDLFAAAGTAYMSEIMANPTRLFEQQVAYWGATVKHFVEAQQALAGASQPIPAEQSPEDRRFSNPLWNSNPYFNFIKQQYLLNANAVERAVEGIEGLDGRDKRRIEFFSRQILDLFSPTNFLATNPDALQRAVETEGQSLIDGLGNLVRDIEANKGEIQVALADKDAFTVGENIATTPGKVVFRNRLFELIQYTPVTETVHKVPLLIFPPWINKFYILDLKEKNSLIRWIVEQGVTLFVVSWVNPDADYADAGLDTYIEEGYLTAIEEVKRITGEPQVNAIGYCIAGTTLSLTLALLDKRGDKSVKSATFFTTLTDFSDQGEFTPFLSEEFIDGIEREVTKNGFLDSFFMSRTFSYLRSNDLVYGPAIRSYMLGEAPPAFDLLFWNGDGTNLPARMAVEYLRWLCQENRFAGDGIDMLGETLRIADVKVPLCAIACETDHIADWTSSYQGVRQMGARSKTFILSQSGHIAGIVNPPSKRKYGHYTNAKMAQSADDWRQGATFSEGSWWPRWYDWLAKRSGKQVAADDSARNPADSKRETLADAPGTYVVAAKR